MTHSLCFPFERNSPVADPITPVLSYLDSLLQWDVMISAVTVTVEHYYTVVTVGTEGLIFDITVIHFHKDFMFMTGVMSQL